MKKIKIAYYYLLFFIFSFLITVLYFIFHLLHFKFTNPIEAWKEFFIEFKKDINI